MGVQVPSEPITRKEQYLAKAAGQAVEIPAEPITREEAYLEAIAKGSGGGGGGTSDYSQLSNKPQINGNTLTGNKTASQLGLASTANLAAKADNTTVGTVQATTTASKDYAIGNYLVLNGVLYRVTTAIASGGSIVTSGVGQNVTATTITAEMEAVEIDYDDWMALTQQERETGNWFVTNYPSVPAPTVDYSITEQKTGQKWIDGKDIYFKTIVLDSAITINSNSWSTTFDLVGDRLVSVSALNSTDNNVFPAGGNIANNKLSILNTRSSAIIVDMIIAYYTKTA